MRMLAKAALGLALATAQVQAQTPGVTATAVKIGEAGADRTNILTQMLGFKNVSFPMILPGITINTSPKRHAAFTQLQLQRWTGTNWELFGNVVSAESD